jgi:surface antigen
VNRVDIAREATREIFGLPRDADLDYITEDLIDEYAGLVEVADASVSARRSDGSAATTEEIGEVVESTATFYGNHPMRLGTCLYWKTNGVGQPCGSGFTAKACNWKSAAQASITSCPGGFSGYRFTLTY